MKGKSEKENQQKNFNRWFFVIIVIILSFLGSIANAAETLQIVLIKMHKEDLVYTVQSVDVVDSPCTYSENREGIEESFGGVVISAQGKALGYFLAPNPAPIICSDGYDRVTKKMFGGCEKMKSGIISMELPYFPDGVMARIYDPQGNEILTIELPN